MRVGSTIANTVAMCLTTPCDLMDAGRPSLSLGKGPWIRIDRRPN
ncbi:hypothetical protein [Microbulbifer sp. DLAB2-AA]